MDLSYRKDPTAIVIAWLKEEESIRSALSPKKFSDIESDVADVAIYLL